MIRRIAISFVIVMGFLLVIAEVQRADDRATHEFKVQ
jgi:hypothetical protein